MVISLDEPTLNDVDITGRVVAERTTGRNRAYFTGIENTWKEKVQIYLDVFGNPERIGASIVAADDSGKFINLYSHPKDDSIQKIEVLDVIRAHGLDYCPACGEDGYPRTLDHYLPKEKFPEFSILSRNLAPMCDACQGAKLAKTLTANQEKIFLHPYYDGLANVQVFKADIIPPFGTGTTTQLRINEDVQPNSLRSLCQRHSDEMGIPSRYQTYFRMQYIRLKKLFEARRCRGAIDVDDVVTLVTDFQSLALLKSCNSWDHVFYTSVIDNPGLLQFLATGNLRSVGDFT